MNQDDLNEMRRDITALIDDIKYHSDSLTSLERLPVIQLKVILAKINKLTEKSTILVHYVEKEGKLSDKYPDSTVVKEATKEQVFEEEKEMLDKITEFSEEQKEDRQKGDLNKLVIKDLFSAIGINEKYLYASTLFNGDTALFKEEVHVLNDIDQLEKAKSHLIALGKKYNWDIENETVQNFYALVDKKFDQF